MIVSCSASPGLGPSAKAGGGGGLGRPSALANNASKRSESNAHRLAKKLAHDDVCCAALRIGSSSWSFRAH